MNLYINKFILLKLRISLRQNLSKNCIFLKKREKFNIFRNCSSRERNNFQYDYPILQLKSPIVRNLLRLCLWEFYSIILNDCNWYRYIIIFVHSKKTAQSNTRISLQSLKVKKLDPKFHVLKSHRRRRKTRVSFSVRVKLMRANESE